jgi:hypothetical protein
MISQAENLWAKWNNKLMLLKILVCLGLESDRALRGQNWANLTSSFAAPIFFIFVILSRAPESMNLSRDTRTTPQPLQPRRPQWRIASVADHSALIWLIGKLPGWQVVPDEFLNRHA